MGDVGRGILDTSILIAESVQALPGELAISAVSLAELHFGVLIPWLTDDQRATRLARLVRVQRDFDAIPLDEGVAESYGRLAARVAAAGRNPRGRVADLLIAATAHAHDAVLYTRNPSDFDGLSDLVQVRAA